MLLLKKATTLAIDCQRRNVAFSGRSLRWHDPDQVQRSATVPVALSACSRRLPYNCPSVIPTLTRVGKEVNIPRRCADDGRSPTFAEFADGRQSSLWIDTPTSNDVQRS